MERRYAAFGLPVDASFTALVAGFNELGYNVEGVTRIKKITSERVGDEIHVAVYFDQVEGGAPLQSEPRTRSLFAPQWPDEIASDPAPTH